MVAKLMKFLSGITALVGCRPNNSVVEPATSDLTVLGLRNVALIRERRELQKRVRRLEAMSDADRAGEHAVAIDAVRTFLQDRHGLNVSRSQVVDAVTDLSDRLKATGSALRKLEKESSAWQCMTQHSNID